MTRFRALSPSGGLVITPNSLSSKNSTMSGTRTATQSECSRPVATLEPAVALVSARFGSGVISASRPHRKVSGRVHCNFDCTECSIESRRDRFVYMFACDRKVIRSWSVGERGAVLFYRDHYVEAARVIEPKKVARTLRANRELIAFPNWFAMRQDNAYRLNNSHGSCEAF